MKATEANNPAGRLLVLLEDALRRQPKGGGSNPTGFDLWSVVFDLEPDSGTLALRMAQLQLLLEDTIARLERHRPESLARYRPHFNQLKQALQPSRLHNTWDSIKPQYTDAALMALAGSSDLLSGIDPDGAVPEDILRELQEAVEGLLAKVVGFKTDFARLVAQLLVRIQKAIIDYRVEGPGALHRVTESVVGAMVAEREVIEQGAKEEKPLHEKLGEVLKLLNSAVEFSRNVAPALSEVVYRVALLGS